MTIDDLIKDQETLKKQLAQAQVMAIKYQGAIEYIDQKIKQDFEANKPKPEVEDEKA